VKRCAPLAACWLLLLVPGAAAEPLPVARRQEIVRQALDAFDRAVAATRHSPQQAEHYYRDAAAGFQTLVESGIRSAALEYNLGNACFRLNDLGRAILHYRRAERLERASGELRANLAYARGRVEPLIEASADRRLAERLLFWQYGTTINERCWFAALCALVGWSALFAWLRWRRPLLAWVGMPAVLLSAANAGLVAWQLHAESRQPFAVVVHGEQTLHSGRGEAYEPVIRQALGPGVELRVIGRRGDWVEVRLANDQTGWLPASAIEQI
jgi:tetratricopeptide (TPR) repeat protein